MSTPMNPRIALVTGATRGLGKEVATRLGRLGYHVVAAARDLGLARQTAEEIERAGGHASAMQIDLAAPATFPPAAAHLRQAFGRLDVLVNNAGVMRDGAWTSNNAATIDMKMLRDTFETNFFGLVELTTILLPLLERSAAANIVNVSSIMGSLAVHADPAGPLAYTRPFAYDTSKTAVNAYTLHLAAALREKGIQVNSAHPGWVKTALGGDAAPMNVADGAETIVELATLPAARATGTFVHRGEPVPW